MAGEPHTHTSGRSAHRHAVRDYAGDVPIPDVVEEAVRAENNHIPRLKLHVIQLRSASGVQCV